MVAQPGLSVSNIAKSIAEGLINTGRAAAPIERAGEMLRLQRKRGGFYWIPFGGGELLSGGTLRDAEPLQTTFKQAMFEAGRAKERMASR